VGEGRLNQGLVSLEDKGNLDTDAHREKSWEDKGKTEWCSSVHILRAASSLRNQY
jgi:hypothetical protein